MKKVLVTGSSGMLGNTFCAKLAENYEVVGFDIKQPPCGTEKNFEFLEVDLTDKAKLQKTIEAVNPDFLIHAAAFTDVDGCEKNPEKAFLYNSEVTEWIARICKDRKSGLLFISTDFVFDGGKNTPYVETDKTNPLSIYGKSKLRAEESISKICDRFYIVRSAWLFGEYGRNFVKTIIEKAKEGKVLRVVDDQHGCPTYTQDLSFALCEFMPIALEGKACGNGIFHLVNSGHCSWYEFAKAIIHKTNIRVDIEPVTSREFARPAKRPEYSILNCAKFEAACGLKLRGWREALDDYIDKNFCNKRHPL